MKDMERGGASMSDSVQIYCEHRNDIPDVVATLRECHVDIYVRNGALSFDGLAPAIIVTGANVLIAVIGGLFSYIQAKHGRTIHLRGTDGFEITVPADTSREELDRLMKLVTERRVDRVVVTATKQGLADGNVDRC